ncbi:hypothetical protein CC80DRAFT_487341 [Byssothecium circinans]|uniref:Uncharacterized protein n=1 Tax=Byssothecium circinans TaxID=147558 RepID=A0A6A5UG20_9PLEO|nr:hypothetical protein CC80DRAFT_487341 [Byssothecium circinans]
MPNYHLNENERWALYSERFEASRPNVPPNPSNKRVHLLHTSPSIYETYLVMLGAVKMHLSIYASSPVGAGSWHYVPVYTYPRVHTFSYFELRSFESDQEVLHRLVVDKISMGPSGAWYSRDGREAVVPGDFEAVYEALGKNWKSLLFQEVVESEGRESGEHGEGGDSWMVTIRLPSLELRRWRLGGR